MSRSPSALSPDRADTSSVFNRLRQLHDQGEIDLVDDGSIVITSDHAVSFTERLQALSDQVSALEATLAKQVAEGDTNLTQLMRDLNATRLELSRLYDVFLSGGD